MRLLETDALLKTYDGRRVVDGVGFSIKRGEIVGLLGPNGAGKTTIFYMIVGIVPPDGGRIFFGLIPNFKNSRLPALVCF